MHRTSIVTLAAIGVLGLATVAMRSQPSPSETRAPLSSVSAAATGAIAAPHAGPVERGAYLVKIMGCNDCHTPWIMTANGPEPDMTKELSGHPQDFVIKAGVKLAEPWVTGTAGSNTAFTGPWGVSFTANLTSDKETGLGKWTPETFIATIRNGRREGQGRQLLPPMPWPMYRNATDDDLKAIFAYLQSIPAVRNRVPLPLDPPGTN